MAHSTNDTDVFFSMLEGMVEQEKVDKNYKPDEEYHDSLEEPFRAFYEIVDTLKNIPNFMTPELGNMVVFEMSPYDIEFGAHLSNKFSISLKTVRKARVDYYLTMTPESGERRYFSGRDTDVETFCYLLEKVFADFIPSKS